MTRFVKAGLRCNFSKVEGYEKDYYQKFDALENQYRHKTCDGEVIPGSTCGEISGM